MEHRRPPAINLWRSADHAREYLARADAIPHRSEGESVLLECLPERLLRVLDLGSGDGRLLHLVKLARPPTRAVAVDFSDTMLERLGARFTSDPMVEIASHDLEAALPDFGGPFDAIVSSFASHHVAHVRERSLYREIFELLTADGVFSWTVIGNGANSRCSLEQGPEGDRRISGGGRGSSVRRPNPLDTVLTEPRSREPA